MLDRLLFERLLLLLTGSVQRRKFRFIILSLSLSEGDVKTEKIIVSDLFEKPRRYLVPLFQRGYVWTKDEQWAPLWDDLLNLVDGLRAQRKSNIRQPRKHFLGAIVLQQQTLGVRHVPVSDVIDGQQRITTLQLVLIALRNMVASLGNDFLNATLERLTRNPGPYVDDTERFKVWPTSVYRDEFSALALADSVSAVEKRFPQIYHRRKFLPRPQLVEAYLYLRADKKIFIRRYSWANRESCRGITRRRLK